MANRHLSRSIVLQTLFEWDFSATSKSATPPIFDVEAVLKRNLKDFAPGLEDDAFVFFLIGKVFEKRSAIDEIIEASAPDWPIDKISIVDRNILRIGLAELLYGDRKEVPPKVAINEAIELAKTFGGENSSKFINGVLGAVYKELGEPNKAEVSRKKKPAYLSASDILDLPVEELGGALVYAREAASLKDDNRTRKIFFALVHDVFGYWTFPKSKLLEGEDLKNSTIRAAWEEIGLDVKIVEKLGAHEYVATHPSKGRILKKVVYFLAESQYKEIKLQSSGGLDGARWFELSLIPELHIYADIVPFITKAIKILKHG